MEKESGFIRLATDKVVHKPWGNEMWLADGTNTPYALKRIFFEAGTRSSLQVHHFKAETNYVLSGTGVFLLSENQINVAEYLKLENKSKFVDEIYRNLREIALRPEVVIDVPAGYVHRVIASTSLTFIECSTVELSDVIRLADDRNRGDGRIESEHRN